MNWCFRARWSAFNEPSLIETQKLMHFLQLDGEPLNLTLYGDPLRPLYRSLRHVLAPIEGRSLTGFADGGAKVLDVVPLAPVLSALPEVEELLKEHPETKARMGQVLDLVEGYESAYGMKLLATMHWAAARTGGNR